MSEREPRRARTLAEFGENADKMFRLDEIGASVGAYRPRPSDVVISPFAKCGTTWLQQIFHCLRTGGDMDFIDISEVVPWIETAACLDIDLEAPQRAEPRGFKSHLPFDKMPKGARYIVALRDPKDALVSFYRFMEGWFFEPGAISFEDFAQARLAGSTADDGYWHHLNSWWAQRDNPDVLLMSYEQMIADPAARIRRVADFCGIPLDAELLSLTLEHSSLAFMLRHKDLFDDALMRRASEIRCDLPPGGDSAKVRKGGSGGHLLEMPAAVASAVDAKWAELTAPVVGFASYAALEAELRRRGQA